MTPSQLAQDIGLSKAPRTVPGIPIRSSHLFHFFFFLSFSFSFFLFYFLKNILKMGHIDYPLFEGVLSFKELATLKVNSIPARGFENKVYKLNSSVFMSKFLNETTS